MSELKISQMILRHLSGSVVAVLVNKTTSKYITKKMEKNNQIPTPTNMHSALRLACHSRPLFSFNLQAKFAGVRISQEQIHLHLQSY